MIEKLRSLCAENYLKGFKETIHAGSLPSNHEPFVYLSFLM